jgi:hypothetical protein
LAMSTEQLHQFWSISKMQLEHLIDEPQVP